MGVSDKVVQAILRHSKVTITRDRYIKAFDPDVIAAMPKLENVVSEACATAELGESGKLLKTRRGEVAERLKAAVC